MVVYHAPFPTNHLLKNATHIRAQYTVKSVNGKIGQHAQKLAGAADKNVLVTFRYTQITEVKYAQIFAKLLIAIFKNVPLTAK
jgi:hypothetical protein